ncbi:hypothetical protein [Agrobacterium vitis]|uniref:hypothetical protein n=1 Tax=Agrobacterium vitis TaxID=373 RepID=UPI001F34FF65|nr:hypothetical protein [Agrobacterium vitis]
MQWRRRRPRGSISVQSNLADRNEGLGSRLAFWLGPDELLVIDEDDTDLMAACCAASAITHRNTASLVSDPGAARALNLACPLDSSLKIFCHRRRYPHRVRQD